MEEGIKGYHNYQYIATGLDVILRVSSRCPLLFCFAVSVKYRHLFYESRQARRYGRAIGGRARPPQC